ncbi:MAG: homocysteine S-methyltransferase family protein, partial [Lachnospiraceae bacterium]
MNRQEFKQLIEKGLLFLDGATGSNLQKRGMPGGACPEQWVLENPQVLLDLQKEYVEAGSNILYSCTFGGNRIKLAEYDLADRQEEILTGLVKISKEAAGNRAWV